jgi:hypothetical protein
MTTLECAETQEHAPEFALGILHGAPRAELIAHLERCQACAVTVADFAEIVDGLTVLAPSAEPPVGFEDHVLRAMHDNQRPRRRTLRTLGALTALVVIVIALSVATVRVVDGLLAPADPARVGSIRANGAVIGKVVITPGAQPWVILAIEGGLPDGRYRAEVLDLRRENVLVGEFDIAGGRGNWIVPESPGSAVAWQVRILNSDGTEVGRAGLPLG